MERSAVMRIPEELPSGRIIAVLFLACAFFSVILPSGSIFGVNVKLVSMLALCLFLGPQLQRLRGVEVCANRLYLLLFVLLFWMVFPLSLYGGDIGLGLQQMKDIIVTFLLPAILGVLVQNGLLSEDDFLEHCYRWSAYLALSKCLIMLFSLASGLPVVQIMEAISDVFGVLLMTYELEDLGGRIHFVSDFLIPPVLYYLIALRRLRFDVKDALYFVALVFSVIISFTRYLWVFAGLAFLLGVLAGGRSGRLLLLGLLGMTVMAEIATGGLVSDLIGLRFSDEVTGPSDLERYVQLDALQKWFEQAPWFGHGLGSYTREVIRSELLPYSYEAQILALGGQIGLVGCVALLVALVSTYWDAMARAGLSFGNLAIALMLALWLASAVFNPNLFSSAAAIIFGVFWAMFRVHAGDRAGLQSPSSLPEVGE